MSNCLPPTSEPFHAPGQLSSLVTLLVESGVDARATLAGTGLEPADLLDGARRTSIDQYLTACRNARRATGDPALGLHVGARSRLSDHGLYGLLLLSSASIREVVRLAVDYQWLATPVVASDTCDGPAGAGWTVADDALREIPDDLRRFVVERQFAQQAAHVREIAGDDCAPVLACFAGPAPSDPAAHVEALGCPCVFDAPRHELRYNDDALQRRPRLAHPMAAQALRATCDGLVAEIEASLGYAGRVYRTLRHMRDPGARMKVVAAELKMTDRTLRRRLADEGTCFSRISHRVKYAVAAQHLRGSAVRIDEIATIAGFSDPANFRRAFIRWTSMSPARFRSEQQRERSAA